MLAGLLVALLLGITGCFVKPDKTVDESPTDSGQVLPFETATPTPSPGPTATGVGDAQTNLDDWQSQTPATVVTREPTATPTIQLYTASPTLAPVVTATPTAKPAATATAKPAATDDGTLRNGSSGSDVRKVQQRLKDLGYYSGSVDGDFGAGTEAAVRSFQSVNGLSVDGIVGSRTLSTLNSSSAKSKPTAKPAAKPTKTATPTDRPPPRSYTPSTLSTYRYLQMGGSGSDVKKMQQRLKDLGYYDGSVNGNFGSDTEEAVEAFQRRNGLWVDGVAGEDTQRLLYSDSALSAV